MLKSNETAQDQLLPGQEEIPFGTTFDITRPMVFDEDNDKKEISSDDAEKKSKEFIGKNLYINWKSANELKAKIKHGTWDIYSVEFEHEFKEWKRKITMSFAVKLDGNRTSMEYQNYQYAKDVFGDINTAIEIDETTHNQYDVVMDWNWNRINFNIVYNEYKTKEFIKNIIKKKEFKTTPQFEKKDEFENTQLGWIANPQMEIKNWKTINLWWRIEWLNNPKLWKEVVDDDNGYYRTLYYSTNWKKYDITKVYFKTNWDFDAEKTAQNKSELNILWIKVDYDITENMEFIISEKSKTELEEKVQSDRDLLINIFNDEELVINSIIFNGLDKKEEIKNNIRTHQFDSKIMCLEPITWIYKIYLNLDWKFDPLYCKVEWNNIVFVDETWRARNEIYINYNKNNRFKFTTQGGKVIVEKIEEELENPKEKLPTYTWEPNAITLLNKSGNLTNFDGGYLNYFDNKWMLISKMPCDKKEDWGYEFNKEKYHTQVEAIKLYNYPWFKAETQEIKAIAADLWIADADIRNIFEESLKNKWFDFNQKVVEIADPDSWEFVYYNMNKNFNIKLPSFYNGTVKECIDSMRNRLRLAQIINKGKAIYANKGEYYDFEWFIWWRFGFWKQIASPSQLQWFISWTNDDLKVRLSRGSGEWVDVTYIATSDTKLSSRLDTWEVTIANQLYSIRTNTKGWEIDLWVKDWGEAKQLKHKRTMWDILFDPKEQRK